MRAKNRFCLAILILSVAACSGGGGEEAQGPPPGSAEWYWEAAVENVEAGDFGKAVEHLESAADGEGQVAENAVVWKTVLTAALAQGYRQVAEAYKSGIDKNPQSAEALRTALQQAQRDARQYTIELLEGLGEFGNALADGEITLAFPFPSGTANESPVMSAVSAGEAAPGPQVASAVEHTLRREQILAAAEMAGEPDAPAAAKTKFEAGPVTVPEPEARLTVGRYLLDLSPLLDRQMINDPKIRKILLDRAEQWIEPQLESENEEHKAAAEELLEKIEDERRDLEGRGRRMERG